MPSYFYHLKFELYPPPRPPIPLENTLSFTSSVPKVWHPSANANIFDNLPSHPRQEQRKEPVPLALLSSYTYDPAEVAEDLKRRKAALDSKDEGDEASPSPENKTEAGSEPSTKDWRFGRVSVETIGFAHPRRNSTTSNSSASLSAMANDEHGTADTLGPTFSGLATRTRAEMLPIETKNTELGWGVVHFYRDEEKTPSLEASRRRAFEGIDDETEGQFMDSDILCMPAVPSYMKPSDLLGFMGERGCADIVQCRMVLTAETDKYLVLVKLKNARLARPWMEDFEGRSFNPLIGSQFCHVVFVKSITFTMPTPASNPKQIEATAETNNAESSTNANTGLVELPTCPVCLERMDETSGLLTIPCMHVFHCTCLQSWKGTGCPVCRFATLQAAGVDPTDPCNQPFGLSVSNMCSVCDSAEDLWICLICGSVGCGRYKGGHAKDHFKQTAHCFALELETLYVWDYGEDVWAHRLIRDKGEGKVMELPSRYRGPDGDSDVVPAAKLESIGLEYTHLMTSQLESQRAFYEDMLGKAMAKAEKASAVAESASKQAANAAEKLRYMEESHRALLEETIPQLEKELNRQRTKTSKSEGLARNMGKALQEERKVNEGLLQRIEHLGKENEELRQGNAGFKAQVAELADMNRDLSMFISGQEKLKEMEKEGMVAEGEVEGGSASVPADRKGKRRAKK